MVLFSDGSLADLQGCFNDDADDHDLPVETLSGRDITMTDTLCIDSCESLGYDYAGVQVNAWADTFSNQNLAQFEQLKKCFPSPHVFASTLAKANSK